MSTEKPPDELDDWLEKHARPLGAPLDAPLPEKKEALASEPEASKGAAPPEADPERKTEKGLEETFDAEVTPIMWFGALASYEAVLANLGKSKASIGQLRSGARAAVDWLVEKGFTPGEVTQAQVEPLVAHIKATMKPPKMYGFKLAAEGLIAEAVAMQSRAATVAKPSEKKLDPPNPAAPEEAPMAQQPPDEVEEQYDEQEEEQEEPSQGQVQKARRVAQRQQPIYIMGPPPRAPRTAPRAPTGPSAGVRRVLGPNTGTVRIHRRGPRGQRVYIEDVPVSDINGPMARYLKEYIEPNQIPDPSGYATYEVSEVGTDGQEKGQPQPISVQSEMSTDTNEPIAQARQVLDFMSQVREDEEARKGHGSEVLKAAQAKAATSGDTNSLMLMMMMERMMASNGNQGNSEAMMMKLLETFKRSNQPSFDLPHYPPPPAPIMMSPPPPPAPSELAPIVGKLLEATIANKVEPKPEKSFMEQMKELMAFKEMLAPTPIISPEIVMLRAEMAAMRAAQSQPKAAVEGGIEGALQTFTKLSDVVKTLAPQINAGGLTGTLQSILTPKLASAVGDMLAGGIQGARAAQQPPVQAPPPQTLQGPKPPPAAVVPLIHVLKAADTEPKQVQATLEVLQGYFNAPGFAPQMEPALQALLAGNREPGIRLVGQVLSAHRPELSKADFAGKVIDALILSATGQAPAPQSEPPKPLDAPTETVSMPETAEAKTPDVEAAPPLTRVEATLAPAEATLAPAEATLAPAEATPAPAAQRTVEATPSEPQPIGPTFAAGTPVDSKDMPITVPALAEQDEAVAHA